jgi:hypothetical protein
MKQPGVLILVILGLIFVVASGCDMNQAESVATLTATPTFVEPARATHTPAAETSNTSVAGVPSSTALPMISETATSILVVSTDTVPEGVGLPTLATGWTRMEPDGDTSCARGTPYHFWVHPGTVNKLLVYFEGGGGCWNYETCQEGSTFFNDDLERNDDPTYRPGMFDLDNPSNPFKDYFVVYVPYCTGDVHWGNNVITYTSELGGELTIWHKGFVNASSAMSWIYSQFESPESIFVTGCSAGSIGSIIFSPFLARHYTQSRLDQLGDSETFVFDHPLNLDPEYQAYNNIPEWLPGLRDMAVSGQLTMAKFYAGIANFFPNHTFSQYSTAHDPVQQRFYFAAKRTPTPEPWENALEASLAEIRQAAPNFRSFVAAGDGHCIIPFSGFYTEETNGVRLRDWIADMAEGKDVPSVHCDDCAP